MTLASEIIETLSRRGLNIAVAESLTGGLLIAELISIPGASDTVNGGLVAYSTELKHTLLHVSAELLALHGAVHPDVAAQMAQGVRQLLAVQGVPADIGIATTGVAGPGPQGGHDAGTAFVGVAVGSDVRVIALKVDGTRNEIRARVVVEALSALAARIEIT